ncbi:MAG: hypothetical protein AB7O52_02615 [Planctomycetota bacterium]
MYNELGDLVAVYRAAILHSEGLMSGRHMPDFPEPGSRKQRPRGPQEEGGGGGGGGGGGASDWPATVVWVDMDDDGNPDMRWKGLFLAMLTRLSCWPTS